MSLRYFTAGESHGPRLTAILDGMPAGVPVTEDDVARDLLEALRNGVAVNRAKGDDLEN